MSSEAWIRGRGRPGEVTVVSKIIQGKYGRVRKSQDAKISDPPAQLRRG